MMPQHSAASMIRSLFSVPSSMYQALPGSPSTRSSGTNTSSRKTSHEPTPRMPNLGIWRVVTPSALPGTRNSVTPLVFFATSLSERASSSR